MKKIIAIVLTIMIFPASLTGAEDGKLGVSTDITYVSEALTFINLTTVQFNPASISTSIIPALV